MNALKSALLRLFSLAQEEKAPRASFLFDGSVLVPNAIVASNLQPVIDAAKDISRETQHTLPRHDIEVTAHTIKNIENALLKPFNNDTKILGYYSLNYLRDFAAGLLTYNNGQYAESAQKFGKVFGLRSENRDPQFKMN